VIFLSVLQESWNDPFFQPIVDVIAVIGPRYKVPSYDDFRGFILQNEKIDYTKRLEEFRASWAHTGCTVMSDGWTNQKGRRLINFLVNSPVDHYRSTAHSSTPPFLRKKG